VSLGQQGISFIASAPTEAVAIASPMIGASLAIGIALAGRTIGTSTRPATARPAKMRPKADRTVMLQRYHGLAALIYVCAICQYVLSLTPSGASTRLSRRMPIPAATLDGPANCALNRSSVQLISAHVSALSCGRPTVGRLRQPKTQFAD